MPTCIASRTVAVELHYFIAETFGRDWRLVIGKRKRGVELGPLVPAGDSAHLLATDGLDRELTSLLHGFRDRHSYPLSIAAI